MRFRFLLIILFITSCTSNNISQKSKNYLPYSAKGFALIYTDNDADKNIISKKIDQEIFIAGHNTLKKNSIITITNPSNNKSLNLKISHNVKYPDFYKILINKKIANELNLSEELPFVEIHQRVKNKSFVAKKAVTFYEEKHVSGKAPVTKVNIKNISNKDNRKNIKKTKKFLIIIGIFYSKESSENLKNFLSDKYIDKSDLKVQKLETNKYMLSAGPYPSINTLKNDYFELNKYGFEDLDIKIYE